MLTAVRIGPSVRRRLLGVVVLVLGLLGAGGGKWEGWRSPRGTTSDTCGVLFSAGCRKR